MKNTIFKFLLILGVVLGIFACSTEEAAISTTTSQDVPFDKQSFIDAYNNAAAGRTKRSANSELTPILFRYENNQEAAERIRESTGIIQAFVDELFERSPEATDIVMTLNVADGFGYINDITLINRNTRTLLDGVIRNPITQQFQTVPNYWPPVALWPALLNGSCPDGYTSLATCNYSDGQEATALCMGTAQARYTFNNAIVGGQINFNLSFGLTAASVCGQTIRP